MQYAIRLDDGTMVLDESWCCEADVLKGYSAFGVRRVYGTLVRRSSSDDDWQPVHPTTQKEAN